MHLKRALTTSAVASAAVVALALPAAASGTASITASVPGGARAAAEGASSAAVVDGPGAGSITGTAAASVGFRVFNAQCFSNDVSFSADTYETGFSGVQRLRQKAQLQEFAGGRWVNRTAASVVTSQRFPNDGRNFHFTRDWDGRHTANGRHWRVLWQGIYLNGGGATVAKTRVISVTC